MSHFRRVVKWIINFLTGLLLVILILVVYGKCVLMFTDNKYPNYFGYTLFEVASGSMEPTLQINDVILVKVNEKKLNKDDIIAYQQDDSVITHRIIMIDNDNLIVKGDANNTVDSPITKGQVIGKVVKVFPKLGIWKRILTEPKILILIFITLLLFDAALSYKGNNKKDNKKLEVENEKDNIDSKIIENEENHNIIQEEIKPEKVKEESIEIKKVEDDTKVNNNDALNKARELALSNLDMLIKEQEEHVEDDINEDYTIRLDLNEIQKNIDKSVK